jgi:D-glycerate 3-kinase
MSANVTPTDASGETSLHDLLARERLPPEFQQWVDDLYRPLADTIAARREAVGAAIVVGMCGPQGSGKSTGAGVLAHLLNGMGVRSAVLSLDDIYLTRAQRGALARSVHPLLMTRGPPGTHDTDLGASLLRDLGQQTATRKPYFDKATDDRAPSSAWPVVAGPADVILFEGWCVGARAQPGEALATPINMLEKMRDADGVWRRFVNGRLAGPYQELFGKIDLQIMFRAPDFDVVLKWRLEQEHKLLARATEQGDPPGSILTDQQVCEFIQYYERLSRHIDAEMPGRAGIVISLDEKRRPISIEVRNARSSA